MNEPVFILLLPCCFSGFGTFQANSIYVQNQRRQWTRRKRFSRVKANGKKYLHTGCKTTPLAAPNIYRLQAHAKEKNYRAVKWLALIFVGVDLQVIDART
jgi:hypothetical protein